MDKELIVQKLSNLASDVHISSETAKMLDEACKLIENDAVKVYTEYGDFAHFNACGNCHKEVGFKDCYCKHCGRKLIWN